MKPPTPPRIEKSTPAAITIQADLIDHPCNVTTVRKWDTCLDPVLIRVRKEMEAQDQPELALSVASLAI